MTEIANQDLSAAAVPAADAGEDTLMHFALTFNGYTYWGSFDKCADIANHWLAEYQSSQRLAPTLTELRTCLFFEQRRWCHYGEAPDAEALTYWRALVEAIRDKIQHNELT